MSSLSYAHWKGKIPVHQPFPPPTLSPRSVRTWLHALPNHLVIRRSYAETRRYALIQHHSYQFLITRIGTYTHRHLSCLINSLKLSVSHVLESSLLPNSDPIMSKTLYESLCRALSVYYERSIKGYRDEILS